MSGAPIGESGVDVHIETSGSAYVTQLSFISIALLLSDGSWGFPNPLSSSHGAATCLP